MKEFKILLDCFENIEKTLEDLIEIKQKFKSKRLLMLLNNKGGLLPSNIKESLIEFYQLIVWKSGDKQLPELQRGIYQTYDDALA